MMDVLMVVLRLVHISAGILWVGFGFFNFFFLAPTIRRVPAEGGKFAHTLYENTPFLAIMEALPYTTAAAGVLLYIKVSDTFNHDWLGSSQGTVWTIGSVAGLAAMGHVVMTLIPTMKKQRTALNTLHTQQGPPSEELLGELQTLGAKLGRNGAIAMVLIVISVICMASARYF